MASRCSAIRLGLTRSDLVAIATSCGRWAARRSRRPGSCRRVRSSGRRAGRHRSRRPRSRWSGPGRSAAHPAGSAACAGRGCRSARAARRPVHDAADRVPGGLRLGRGDGDLAADQGVGQRRLAGVGPADEAGEAGAEVSTDAASRRTPLSVGLRSGATTSRVHGSHGAGGVGEPDRDAGPARSPSTARSRPTAARDRPPPPPPARGPRRTPPSRPPPGPPTAAGSAARRSSPRRCDRRCPGPGARGGAGPGPGGAGQGDDLGVLGVVRFARARALLCARRGSKGVAPLAGARCAIRRGPLRRSGWPPRCGASSSASAGPPGSPARCRSGSAGRPAARPPA